MNKKEKKVLRFLKTNILTSVAIFLVIFCVVVFAGDVIVKEGAVDVGEDLNVSGDITITDGVFRIGEATIAYEQQQPMSLELITDGNVIMQNLEVIGSTVSLKQIENSFTLLTGAHMTLQDNVATKYGTSGDSKIYWDGTNLIITTTNGTASNTSSLAWFSGAVSATNYTTRTSVYDKSRGDALSFIKDADDYKTDSEIDHTKFYGYVSYDVTDMSRPEFNETSNETYYPYKIKEQGVSLNSEIDVLRQAVYELKLQNQDLLNRIEVLEGK